MCNRPTENNSFGLHKYITLSVYDDYFCDITKVTCGLKPYFKPTMR